MSSLRKRLGTLAKVLTALALVGTIAGCRQAPATGAAPSDPFTTSFTGPEFVELRGYAHGHRAGDTARFEVTLRNDGAERWQGRYCLFLVDRSGPIATLATFEFGLEPHSGEVRTIDAHLSADLAEGCYGLVQVLSNRRNSVNTITVGDVQACDGGWPVPACPPE